MTPSNSSDITRHLGAFPDLTQRNLTSPRQNLTTSDIPEPNFPAHSVRSRNSTRSTEKFTRTEPI